MFSEITSNFGFSLNEVLTKWADTLEANSDDLLYVDGEEGDCGTIRYYETVANGEKVHLLTEYINQGDSRDLRITQAGLLRVERVALKAFVSNFPNTLDNYVDTGKVDRVVRGEVATAYAADAKLKDLGAVCSGDLDNLEGLPRPEHIYGYKNRYFRALLSDTHHELLFVDICDPYTRLVLLGDYYDTFMLSPQAWAVAFEQGSVGVAEVKTT